MKRAVILHGTDGGPDLIWIPWLKQQFEAAGYEVWAPLLPENHTPNRERYNDFLFGGEWDFTDNIVVGHSSGAVSVLNVLMDERCPKIKLGVLVSAWAHGEPVGEWDPGQFDTLFPAEGFNFEHIRKNAEQLVLLHSADDPYCPLEQAKYLATELAAQLIILPHAGHIGHQFPKLHELWEIIRPTL